MSTPDQLPRGVDGPRHPFSCGHEKVFRYTHKNAGQRYLFGLAKRCPVPGTPHFLRLTAKTWLSMNWDTLFIRSGKKPVQAFGDAGHPGTT